MELTLHNSISSLLQVSVCVERQLVYALLYAVHTDIVLLGILPDSSVALCLELHPALHTPSCMPCRTLMHSGILEVC